MNQPDNDLASYSELLSAFRVQIFKAGDAAKLLGVPHETLGHWRRTRASQPQKRDKGWARYSGRDLASFAVIRDAQHIGYSHDLAREFSEFANIAIDELSDFLSDYTKTRITDAVADDFCLVGLYQPVGLDEPSLSERRKAWEEQAPFSGPQVRLFTSKEALARHVAKPHLASQNGIPFYYTPTILRLVRRWMVSMAEE
ncbi:MAG: hypothetical protein C0456_03565 [Hyphomonas sp.]|uniref:MerR family transcriptional regulator n=1 Tax=Hyphomonas sp. TaxID=87 RepID=UPI001D6EDDE0|nr:MerR family transcriptional regulator [Hyphomonas sp.]MBA4225686.1 hypothetical protein [Hyphomonas sp.]